MNQTQALQKVYSDKQTHSNMFVVFQVVCVLSQISFSQTKTKLSNYAAKAGFLINGDVIVHIVYK